MIQAYFVARPLVAAVYDRRFYGNSRDTLRFLRTNKTGGHRPPLQWGPLSQSQATKLGPFRNEFDSPGGFSRAQYSHQVSQSDWRELTREKVANLEDGLELAQQDIEFSSHFLGN